MTPNQTMKPTAPLRYNFSALATTPCRGLSYSRSRRLADLDCFLEERGDVDDRALVARVNREQRFIKSDPFADFLDFGTTNRKIDRSVRFLPTAAQQHRRPTDQLGLDFFHNAGGFGRPGLNDLRAMLLQNCL